MAFGRSSPPAEGSPTGLKEELGSFLKESSAFASARAELFAIEAREASQIMGRRMGLLLAGGGLLVIAYLLILTAFIGLLGRLLADSGGGLANWIGATLIVAALHAALGVVFLLKGRRIGQNVTLFELSKTELLKDQAWLRDQKKN